MIKITRKMFGLKKDTRDDRDHLMRAYLPLIKLPEKIDFTRKMTPVRSQGDEGTCVGFASTVGMKEYQEKSEYKKTLELSPRFVYNECKKLDGHPQSEGTQIRIAMKVLKNLGVCLEQYWRYEPHDNNGPDAPSRKILADAKKNRILSYARILDLNELKLNLAHKGPCVIGIICYSGIMNTRTGKVPMPKRGEREIGGHAICPVGYDDAMKMVKFKNSWGEEWGDKGYGYLPYAYIDKYMMDAWSSVDIVDKKPMTINGVLRKLG